MGNKFDLLYLIAPAAKRSLKFWGGANEIYPARPLPFYGQAPRRVGASQSIGGRPAE